MSNYRYVKLDTGQCVVFNGTYPVVQVQDEVSAQREVERLRKQDEDEELMRYLHL